ncbi:RelA/SpoT domain-containing protein [Flavicella marina]|uniref:RelA/SpoT domain-containing protein n=1 Tax=Flavicella marina TaxID=1475951 RepID=UPI0012653C81|nr:RelA/SpoT domain-containing protein [Flavicella marina]
MNYSRKKITKAGNILMTSKSNSDIEESLDIINEWRTSHLYPLKVMKNGLLRLLKKNKISPILVSQRLKRLTSIEYKLDLNEKMGLGGMQDIGGYRAVLKDRKDLIQLKNILEFQKTNHKLEKVVDYVDKPKPSGYRSIHFIYRYSSVVEQYNDLKLELQIRTKLQHNWATAVETAGIITKTSLKSSQGPDEWLEFFKIVSSLFAIKEKMPKMEVHKDKSMQELMIDCYTFCNKYSIITTLKALRVSTKRIETDKFPGDYYLINIDFKEKSVNLRIFNKNQFELATSEYLEIEKNIEEDKNAVVLVSATSIKALKKAYPSYFLDTSEFILALESINKNCIDRGYI